MHADNRSLVNYGYAEKQSSERDSELTPLYPKDQSILHVILRLTSGQAIAIIDGK